MALWIVERELRRGWAVTGQLHVKRDINVEKKVYWKPIPASDNAKDLPITK
jgi:hypothetical protein